MDGKQELALASRVKLVLESKGLQRGSVNSLVIVLISLFLST